VSLQPTNVVWRSVRAWGWIFHKVRVCRVTLPGRAVTRVHVQLLDIQVDDKSGYFKDLQDTTLSSFVRPSFKEIHGEALNLLVNVT
jgi:hypothetical protein